MSAPRTTTGVTGEMLYEELRVAAVKAGVSIQKYSAPLFSEPNWKLEQLRIARQPNPNTIARVRARISGEPIPPPRGGRFSGGSTADSHRVTEVRVPGDVIEQRRRLTEAAHENRLPGETIASAVRRIEQQQVTIEELAR